MNSEFIQFIHGLLAIPDTCCSNTPLGNRFGNTCDTVDEPAAPRSDQAGGPAGGRAGSAQAGRGVACDRAALIPSVDFHPTSYKRPLPTISCTPPVTL